MATIENDHLVSPADVRARLATLPDEVLLAQDLVQQGAVHAVSWLLANGCDEISATAMLDSLSNSAALIRDEAKRRGKPALFDRDQIFSAQEGDRG